MPDPRTVLHGREQTPDPRPPLPHDPPPPPGYVDPLGDEGLLSDLTKPDAHADADADAE